MLRVVCYSCRCLLLLVSGCWFLAACGNNSSDKAPESTSDTLPADIKAINEKINNDRGNADLYFQRAKADFQHKNTDEAFNDMRIAMKIDSVKPDYYIFLSDLYFTQNKTKDTRDLLRKAISLDTANSEALMKYSQLFYLLRKYDTATFYINRALHHNNSSAVAHFQKGMILKEWGDTAKAISSFQDAVQHDQNYYDAYMQLGLLLSIKKNPLALGYFDDAINLKPNSIEALYAKGKCFQNTQDYDNALKTYAALLAIEPLNQDAMFNTGAVLFEQKKYDEAMEKFNEILKRDDNFYRAYYGRGRCHEAKGETQKAIEEYKKCLSIKPDYDLAAVQLDIIDRKALKKRS